AADDLQRVELRVLVVGVETEQLAPGRRERPERCGGNLRDSGEHLLELPGVALPVLRGVQQTVEEEDDIVLRDVPAIALRNQGVELVGDVVDAAIAVHDVAVEAQIEFTVGEGLPAVAGEEATTRTGARDMQVR